MMRLPVTATLLGVLVLGGCSPGTGESVGTGQAAMAASPRVISPARRETAGDASIASLPDVGDLLRYDSVRRIEPAGAYTSYPVRLSEAHAYQALAGGELVVTAPDGERIRLQGERHEEYPDGNWSLIASDRTGARSLLTFGQDAVFGSITRADGSVLRVTTRHRQVYLVAVDREQLARMENPGAAERVDMLIPPTRMAASAGASRAASSGRTQAQAATSVGIAAANDIDVLMGYSNGLVARIGSESGAVTRMQSLVAVANEAYGNSGITMRLRLVRSMLVNFTDNTTNEDALQKLTGSSGSGSIPVDPAFAALRAAREESGADLVSLVRQFREPENDGCGIAWLLGGEQTAIIPSDAPFGYSVVSDGSDVRESDGETYFCREETFVHELGHNMGQAHNQEDSTSAGAHPYSYGYREASATGFFTVMAYRLTDSSQTGIRYFANPSISVSGRPTGVANQSDNARSVNQVAPVIATFRAGLGEARAKGDFNSDGDADILWRNRSTGANTMWLSAQSATDRGVTGVSNLAWTVAGVGDFNGDGQSDMLWRDRQSGRNVVWLSGNASTLLAIARVNNFDWKISGIGDFDGDGRDDIFWRNTRTGYNDVWRSGDSTRQLPVARIKNFDWIVAGVGDFNGDGETDILWRNIASGANSIWFSGDFTSDRVVARVNNFAWIVAGVGDFDGDGRADLLWRNRSTGANQIWRATDSTDVQAVASLSTGWYVAGVDDFNGDSLFDVLWRNSASGANMIWRSGNSSATTAVTAVPNFAWLIQGSPVG